MSIDDLKQRIHAVGVEVPRYQEEAAYLDLFLEFAGPLAKAVVAREATDQHSCTYCDCGVRGCEWEGWAEDVIAQHSALPQAREVLAAQKEE